ncbi:histidine kinase-like protein [Kitasatospora sp. SolWspMP-SS2h]|uniref:ATP-binding SpoIIE family protein phosphatase n=1 Tax=Kitasatospora sp. SolWspMP-SS2h TaxID=1305729 RepID=UPI000DBA7BFF|nr:ATP-binding SpoIIE family protein phosphatase [Kitasatospora sp. SolWspMP-SS2h]RAJ30392.1 histidine kinase-like protein [Kitasatospora sp. SolWspMP-SS2h]
MRDHLESLAGQQPAVPVQRHPPPGAGRSGEAASGVPGRLAERLAALDRAARLINSSLDLTATLRNLGRVLVPAVADALVVLVRDPLPDVERDPGPPRALRVRHTRGTRLGRSAGVRPVLPGGELERLLARRAASGPTVLDGRRRGGPAAELLGARALGRLPAGTALLALPLHGRQAALGVLLLVRRPRPDGSPAGFDPADAATAAHLATHGGLAVDTALRYTREWEIADELQRSMLPAHLPQPHGVRLAHRYLPGERGAQVGGDWYDSIPLPGNRVALITGDVMGHSLTSAAVMGQLRTSAQTLAGLDLPPHEVLYHLDEQAQRLGREQHLATCVYAVYDPIAGRVRIANAGHVPPVLIGPDGSSELLELPSGAPIGVGGVDFASVELPAPPGSALLLFTDGLVETRHRPLGTGLELLRARLAGGHRFTPEQLCQEALRILPPGDRADDIALLAAAFDGIPAEDVAHWHLRPRHETPGRARRLAGHALRRWGLDHLAESCELMVSELVTNAIQHATRPVTLRLVRTSVLRCEVGDDSPALPRTRRAGPEEERGRGLQIVSRCADRWGATRLGAGKVVWFEQRLDRA